MNSNTYMTNGPGDAQQPSWQGPNQPHPPERRALSIPGGLPPTITPPPPVAQFGAASPSPAKSDSKRLENAKKEDTAFPELGRAGSVLGWFVNWVSPRTETGPSAGTAATSGNLILSAAEANAQEARNQMRQPLQ
jgi:hypothetical protein